VKHSGSTVRSGMRMCQNLILAGMEMLSLVRSSTSRHHWDAGY